MLIVRDIMYCKPGQVRPLVEKFVAMSRLSAKAGMPPIRVMTDLSAERFWTVVAEIQVENLQAMEDMFSGKGESAEIMKELEPLMKGYHELVDHGRREIYKLEG